MQFESKIIIAILQLTAPLNNIIFPRNRNFYQSQIYHDSEGM